MLINLKGFRFRPALFDALRGYNRHDLMADMGSGLTVACVALPLAMAFGIASGVKPEHGLITAVIGGGLVSLLGGSRVQIGGPAGAFVAMLYAISQQYGLANMLLATCMAGIVLFAMGALRMGQMIRFVPTSIVVGFTNGIAIVIMLSQVKDFFGLQIEQMPANFLSQVDTLLGYRAGINLSALALASAALLLIYLWPKPPKLLTQRKAALKTPINTAEQAVTDLGPATLTTNDESEFAIGTTAAATLQPLSPAQGRTGSPAPNTTREPSAAADAAAPAQHHPHPAHGEAHLSPEEPSPGAFRRFLWRVPAPLVVLILGTLVSYSLKLPVETIGSRFGGIPQSLPAIQVPDFDWTTVQSLVIPTLSIAFLCAMESLLCARVADGMTRDRHDPNQELMAQGVANMVTPLFGGIAVTGTIARTVTNIRSGGRTPIAGVVHALTLLVFMLVLAPLAVHIPMAVLAGILMSVGLNMGEWHAFKRLRVMGSAFRITLLTTFALTVIFDLTIAVQVGLLLASLFFIYRISTLTRIDPIAVPDNIAQLPDGRRVGVWQAFGSLFFGSVGRIEAMMEGPAPLPQVVVLEMHKVIFLDNTGLDALSALRRTLDDDGGRLIIAGANRQPLDLMQRTGFLDELGANNVFGHLDEVYRTLGSRVGSDDR